MYILYSTITCDKFFLFICMPRTALIFSKNDDEHNNNIKKEVTPSLRDEKNRHIEELSVVNV